MVKKGRKHRRASSLKPDNGPVFQGRYVFSGLLLAGLLLYSQVIFCGPFLFDDEHFIVKNRYVQSFNHIPEMFTRSTTDGAFIKGNFYRPMQSFLHAAVNLLFGMKPWPHHLVLVLIHIINSCLLYRLLVLLGCFHGASLAGASLFLVHPVQVEAVAYISGASDPLCLVFILLGFLAYITAFQRKKNGLLAVALLCFVAALFSKETASIVVALLVLHTVIRWNAYTVDEKKKAVLMSGLTGLFCIGYVVFRFTVLNFTGNFGLTGADNVYTSSLLVRAITFVHSVAEYAGMLLAPLHMFFEKPYEAYLNIFDIKGMVGFGILIVAAVTAWRSLQGRKYVFFAWSWVYICLLPVSGVVPLNAMYLDHWLYLPSVGLAMLAAVFCEWSAKKIQWENTFIVLGIILLLLGVRTAFRNADWSDIARFYEHELVYNETSARMHNNLGMEYEKREKLKDAIVHYRRAIELNDTYAQSHHNLAQIYAKQGMVNESLQELFRALEIDPTFIYSYQTMLAIFTSLEKPELAARCRKLMTRVEIGKAITFNTVRKTFPEFFSTTN